MILNAPIFAVPGGDRNDIGVVELLQQYSDELSSISNGSSVYLGDIDAFGYFASNANHLPDGVHPDAAGRNALARYWANAITRVL